MWARAQEMLEDTERLRRRFFGLVAREPLPCWEPPVDIFEYRGDFWIVVALPGVEPRSIEVRFGGSNLMVVARRELPAALREARILRMELPSGRFERSIDLPAGTYRLLDQSVEQGCLMLRLARVEGAR
jgi:HSP20 family protein